MWFEMSILNCIDVGLCSLSWRHMGEEAVQYGRIPGGWHCEFNCIIHVMYTMSCVG